jgi:IS5 family transposase
MYLKFRYKLGYEALVAEVSNSISWRLFCRIGLSGTVPEASTLCKLTKGRARAAAATLNDALLTKLVEQGTVKGRRVRSDTTVLPANIVYPTTLPYWPMACASPSATWAGCTGSAARWEQPSRGQSSAWRRRASA